MWLGEKTSGWDKLEEADVSAEWVDENTRKVTLAGTGTTDLNVGAFDVEINVFFSGGSFYDHAEGIAET